MPNHPIFAVPAPHLLALVLSTGALLVGVLALVQAGRRARDVEALHDRLDAELEQWRETLKTLSDRAEEAHYRASHPSMPGDAALRLHAATEGVEDLQRHLESLGASIKRESEQRLATEVALYGALDELKQASASRQPAAVPARRPRSSSLFEIVEFGDESASGK